ncbi:MAG: S41 family peptidase, partial [Gemmatimonadaceae bacterium]
GAAIVFERAFGVWFYDIASGNARQVEIALRGAPASSVAEHQTLSTGYQQLALSPDAKKVAVVLRGDVYAANAKEGGEAARVTISAGNEDHLAWAPDSRRLAYSSDRDGASHIYVYDFGTRTERQLTTGAGNEITPRWSPDGSRIAYSRNGRELHVMQADGSGDHAVSRGHFSQEPLVDGREVVWSPDGKWLAYLDAAGIKQFQNAFVVPVTGGPPRQVSWMSNAFGGAISWSSDGTYLMFGSGQRTENGDIVRVDLVPRPPKFREDQFRDLFNTSTPQSPTRRTQQPGPQPPPVTPAATPDSATQLDSAAKAASAARRETRIVFDDIRQRAASLPTGLDAGDAVISPDGKSLLFTGRAAGQANLYTWNLDENATNVVARQLTSTTGFKSSAQWSRDSKEVYYLESGRANIVNVESRAVRPLAMNAEVDIDFTRDRGVVFQQVWSYLRDNFFDPQFHGVDWAALRAEYAPRIDGAGTPDEARRIMSLMIGELNASHMGVGGPPSQQPYSGRLGVRFDRVEYERSGRLRIAEIIPLGPVSLAGGIKEGDVIVSVDGQVLNAVTNLDSLLAYRTGRQVALRIESTAGSPRSVNVRPISTGAEKALLYRAWVESRRSYVARSSGGKLGYVHMINMSDVALRQLYTDLDSEQHDRQGVVVDIRNNNGGFVNAYALDVFSRSPYLGMQTRGFPKAPARTQLGQRSLELPTVLVTNQQSLSDAEDFTEGYRAQKLGRVVGEPTAGWIIFTWNQTLFDGTTLRLPRSRITAADGTDMELHPRPVDQLVVRPMGESYTSVDSQLDAAVKVLLAQIAR